MDLSGMDMSEGMPSMEQMQQQQQAKAQYEEQKANILDQILEPGTKDRIQRLSIVNPDMATRIQDSLIQAATSGQLRNKVSIITDMHTFSVYFSCFASNVF
jgi:DNA-binding TFAR19-related protein (PDSD5 family)